MNRTIHFKAIQTLFLLILFLIPAVTFSQEIEDIDTAFEEARQLAFDGEREEARRLAYAILELEPDYLDVRVFIARTYSWDGMYSRSRSELEYVLDHSPDHMDALMASIDNEVWSENPDQAVQIANQATRFYPLNVPILLKSAWAHHLAGQVRDAVLLLNRIDQFSPANREALDLRKSMQVSSQNYNLTGSFTYDHFSDVFDPAQEGLVELSRRSSIGTVYGRLNYGNRFDTFGFQPEIDFYPNIADGWYGYLNIGYANSIIFPEFRTGAELFKRVGNGFEGSLGLRFLRFQNSDVMIYTGTVTKYYGSWLFILRPYIANSTSVGTSSAINLMGRRFFSGTENYITFRGGFGFSPEDRRFQDASGDLTLTKSQFVMIEGMKSINTGLALFTSLEFSRRELSFSPGNYIEVISLRGGLQLKF